MCQALTGCQEQEGRKSTTWRFKIVAALIVIIPTDYSDKNGNKWRETIKLKIHPAIKAELANASDIHPRCRQKISDSVCISFEYKSVGC